MHYWLSTKFVNFSNLTKENVIFGTIVKDPVHDLAINSIIILGKFFIHKNRFLKSRPNFYVFHKELCLYFSSLKHMKKKNAMKLSMLVEDLNLTEKPEHY